MKAAPGSRAVWLYLALVWVGISTPGTAQAAAFNQAGFEHQQQLREERLRDALAAFDRQLREQFSDRERNDWHEYVDWDRWAGPALKQKPWNVDAMKPIVKRFFAASDGFENEAIAAVRWAMIDYLDLAEAVRVAEGDLAGEYARRENGLREALRSDDPDYRQIEESVWWLSATGQADALLQQVRSRFSGPAIVGQIHRELVEEKLEKFHRETRESRVARNRIQGTTVTGETTSHARTTAQLVEGGPPARVRVVTEGNLVAPRNVSSSGRVRVVSSSHSDFRVVSELYWDGARVTMTPPVAEADTEATIRNIDAPPLLRRAARRRVQQKRGAAQAQAEKLIETEAAAEMQAKLAGAVDRMNARSRRFLRFLEQSGNEAERWTTQVRPNALQIGYLPRSLGGLGSIPRPPLELAGHETLSLSFHDSAFEGILSEQVAGAIWQDVNFAKLQRELTGGNTEGHLIGLDPRRWSVQWSWRRPVQIHFKPEHAAVRYRFDRVVIDGAAYDTPLEIVSYLDVSASRFGHQVQRVRPLEVTSVDPRHPAPEYVIDFLHEKFEGYGDEPFRMDGLQFPAGGEMDGLSGFRSVDAVLADHWLHLKYSNRRPQASVVVHENQ